MWVNSNFVDSGRSGYNLAERCVQNKGPHKIEPGNSAHRELSVLHVQCLAIVYQQQEQPLCVLFSFVNALVLYGDSVAVPLLLELQAAMLDLKTEDRFSSDGSIQLGIMPPCSMLLS